MGAEFPVTERESDAQITLFDSVGFAIEYFSTLRYVNDLAQSLNIGNTIPLVPELDNPKDLCQLMKPTAAC